MSAPRGARDGRSFPTVCGALPHPTVTEGPGLKAQLAPAAWRLIRRLVEKEDRRLSAMADKSEYKPAPGKANANAVRAANWRYIGEVLDRTIEDVGI